MSRLKAFYQLTKPGIIYGNVMTATAGFLYASEWHIGWGLLAATLFGTSLVIASACVYNNVIDRNIDGKMSRTKKRALVSGQITPRSALIYATILGVTGFAGLSFYTNWWVVALGVVAFVDYIVLYGLSKRHSVHGTLVGSVAGAASLTAGYLAVTNNFDRGAWLLFLIMVAWQMPHFYAIAIYRLKDYAAAGLPVLPIKKGLEATKLQIIFYILVFMSTTTSLMFLHKAGVTFAIIMTFMGLWWLRLGLKAFTVHDSTVWARQMFLRSLTVLLALSISLAFASVLP